MTKTQAEQSDSLAKFQRQALLVGAGALALCVLGILISGKQQFFQSYLMAFMFWLGVPIGCTAIVMLHHLTGGRWGVVRPILEAAMRCLPLNVLLFLPLLLGLPALYQWARPDEVAHNPLLQHKEPYLNVRFFLIRAAIYFFVWNVFAHFLNRWSRQQAERPGDWVVTRRLQKISGPGLLAFALTVTFAAFDWMMSLDPAWFSTIYGMLIATGQMLTAFAFVCLVLSKLAERKPLSGVITADHFHDLGTLMFAFVMLWAYVSLSQFLIIWSGNLPEETPWYIKRTHHGWGGVAMLLVLFQFALPFLLLLSRSIKRVPQRLAKMAILVLVMRLVDLFWLIAPELHPHGFHLSWLDLVAPIGIGGIWVSVFLWQLGRRPLLPVNVPEQEELPEPQRA